MTLTRRQAIAGSCAALVAGSLGHIDTESVRPECRGCWLLNTEIREQLRQAVAALRQSVRQTEEALAEVTRLSGMDFRRQILKLHELVNHMEATLDGIA